MILFCSHDHFHCVPGSVSTFDRQYDCCEGESSYRRRLVERWECMPVFLFTRELLLNLYCSSAEHWGPPSMCTNTSTCTSRGTVHPYKMYKYRYTYRRWDSSGFHRLSDSLRGHSQNSSKSVEKMLVVYYMYVCRCFFSRPFWSSLCVSLRNDRKWGISLA